MKKRIFSTILLWTLLFFVLSFGRIIGCFCLLLAASALTQYEFYQLLKQAKYQPDVLSGILLGTCLPMGCAFTNLTIGELLMLIVIISSLLASFKRSLQFVQQSLIPTLVGVIYIPFMLSFVVKFVQNYPQFATSQAVATVFLLIAISKFSDVGALLIGCQFGHHKLMPSFSPNKTFEGLLGGVAASTIIGITGFLVFKHYLVPQLTITNVTILSIILSLVSPLGDIIESATKRIAGVKDSGHIIPGIGGILDLMDSLIFSLPLGVTLLSHGIL